MANCIVEKDQKILKTNRLNITVIHGLDGMITFKAYIREDDEYAGYVSLVARERCFGRAGEISYELEDKFRGQCYATEMLRSVIAYSYAELDLVNLYGVAPEKNIAAQYVLQRVGFAVNEELENSIRFEAWNPVFQTAQEL